jgi:Helix-turn-helix
VLGSLNDLPTTLIKARISAGMTQKELAEKIGIREQQIQRYEANHYNSASFVPVGDSLPLGKSLSRAEGRSSTNGESIAFA